MNREAQLEFCKKCLKRKMDMKQGLLCELTGQKAAFEGECADFKLDESVNRIPPEAKEDVSIREIRQNIAPEIMQKLKAEQNLNFGIIAGIIAGIIFAILWGVITVATEYQIGYMAIAVGAGVGFAIRIFGKGIDSIFGYWGAGISLVSVVLGNFLSIIGFLANAEGLGYLETINLIDYSYLPEIMIETFNPMDLLFYGFAIYEGYKFSFRQITEDSLGNIK